MRIRTALVGALLAVVAHAEPPQDQMILIQDADAEMNAAIAHAQATLDEFLQVKANPPNGASGFKIKVKISDSHGTEHIWVSPFDQADSGFVGILAGDPEIVRSVSNGQRLTFSRGDVSDWGYVLDGKQKGSFTVCVVFRHMPVAEVEQYRQRYGFEC